MKDTEDILKCPACGKEMEKIYIKDKEFYLDICTQGCGGILFDNRELKHFDEPHKNIDEILEVLKNKKYEKVNTIEQRICPVCLQPMVKHFANTLKEVEIDECYGCGAIFLDYGELEQIRSRSETEKERQDNLHT